MKRLQLLTIVLAIFSSYVWAQRPTDKLGRGLVAVKTDAGMTLITMSIGTEHELIRRRCHYPISWTKVAVTVIPIR